MGTTEGTAGARGAEGLSQVAVALDTSDRATFEHWCALFGPRVGVLKVGLEAYVRWGPSAVEIARRHARAVFLDLKLHDIPNTVAAGARRGVRSLEGSPLRGRGRAADGIVEADA